MHRITVSPAPSRHTCSDDYYDDYSTDDMREAEATLCMVDDKIANAEDALTRWCRGVLPLVPPITRPRLALLVSTAPSRP